MPEQIMTNADRETERSSEEGKETLPESSTEDKSKEDETASLAGDKGEGATSESEKSANPKVFQAFHEHPKWKGMVDKLKELEAFRENVLPLLDKLGETKKVEETRAPEKRRMSKAFVSAYGENQELWDEMEADRAENEKRLRAELRAELAEEQQVQTKRQSEEVKKWNGWVDAEMQDIFSDEEVKAEIKQLGIDFSNEDQSKSLRNEILAAAIKQSETANKDANMWRAMRSVLASKAKNVKSNTDANKKIADKAMSRGKPEEEGKSYKTSHDLAGIGFRDFSSM